MSSGVCLLKPDLSAARGVTPDAAWRARRNDDSEPQTLDELRSRVQEAAQWAAGSAQGRRLAWACLDVDEMLCTWMRAQSLAAPVLVAAWRSLVQEWGERLPAGMVEPLIDDHSAVGSASGSRWGKRSPAAGAALREHFAVLAGGDSLLRLWLDALDQQGVRVERVASLWHAMVHAWGGEDADLNGVVMIDGNERLVWTWSRGGGLECGGSARIEHPSQPSDAGASDTAADDAHEAADPLTRAAARMMLDWASWGCHLGTMPARVRVVGPAAAASRVGELVARRLTLSAIQTLNMDDPIGAALAALQSRRAADVPPSARYCLAGATRRPTRAVRTRYWWGAGAAAVAALALAVAGVRLNSAAKGSVRQASELFSTASAEAVKKYPTVEGLGVITGLSDRLARVRLDKPADLPPRPRPLLRELTLATEVLTKFSGVRINSLKLDQLQQAELIIAIPERRVGETIGAEMATLPSELDWQPRARQQGADQLILEGKWR